ncbi:MAG TPA: TonB-dependent receptor plug domain-containing protein, partial [Vicinamibacterales bacterium]|nr:TonB-dependent receptor plug domain-containing protein [Vicinamibacterales bacterium]
MVLAVLLAIFVGQDIIGIVKDTNGGTVPNAVVVLRSPVGQQQTVTGSDGIFSFSDAPDGSTVVVRAPGFSVTEQQVPATGMVEVIVSPAPLLETLTVTATRTEERLGALPASVHVLSTQEIRQSAAVTADEILRRIPTFSLFRRTSSLSSHPTAQGVSLRGIGPSGVSRTLVLLDGVPFNDPFGGWVYWTRVPMGSIERIEVVDGASSSLYGNYAMGGVINMVT